MYNIQDFYESTGDKEWLNKYAFYIKKIREEDFKKHISSEDFILKHIKFLLEENCIDTVIDCLMHYNEVPPLYSKKILDAIKQLSSRDLK